VGAALFRVLPLPVPLDTRFITSLLEANELIKTLFEPYRFLLPVPSYGGLKFAKYPKFYSTFLEIRKNVVHENLTDKAM